MYRVLIADDEYWTREKIRNMIEWDSYNLEFMEPAVDGEQALEKIEREKPDIFITDINMPFINGMDLVRIIYEKHPEIIVIVVSGYDDYEYVRNTLTAGAVDYLLKPVSKAELVKVLSRALEILGKKIAETEEEAIKKDQMLKASSLIQDREFSSILESAEAVRSPNLTVNLNLNNAGYRLVMLKVHNIAYSASCCQHDMSLLSYNMKKEIRDFFEEENIIVFNYIYRSNEFLLLTEMEENKLVTILKKMSKHFENLTRSPVTITVSSMGYSLNNIKELYTQTVSLLMLRPFTRQSTVIEEKYKNKDFKFQSRISEAQENSLKVLMLSENRKKIKAILCNEIGLKNAEIEGWRYLEVRQTLKRIVSVLCANSQNGQEALQLTELDNLTDLLDKTSELLDLESIIGILDQIIDICIDTHQMEVSETISGTILQVAKYIRENYHEELSLGQLAKRFLIESSYLSRLFRQQMGENLMSYIARQRMERAKQYICQGDISLTEISFLVGYDDYNYFSRVFKKMVGISPREYKASMEEEK